MATYLPSADFLPRLGCPPSSLAGVEEWQFALMAPAYRQRGGLITGDQVAGLLRGHVNQPVSVLARWIVTRRLISFPWRCETWIPLFQFSLSDMWVRQDVRHIVGALTCAFDDWELALWFVMPNAWLQDIAPLDLIDEDPSAVLHAARTDRFVAMG